MGFLQKYRFAILMPSITVSLVYLTFFVFYEMAGYHIFLSAAVLAVTSILCIYYFKWRALSGILVFLGLLFYLTIPYFSPIDEGAHFDYIRHIMKHQELPNLGDTIDSGELASISSNAVPSGIQYEAVHPPLYYVLSALLSVPFFNVPQVNFFLIRLLGLLMLAFTLVFLAKTIKLFSENSKMTNSKILIGGVIFIFLFNPGILTRMITVSNESLVVLLFSAQIYYVSKIYFSREVTNKAVIVCSLLTAGLILTKLTAVYMVVVVALLFVTKNMYRKLYNYLIIVGVTVSPWFLYNIATYNNITGMGIHTAYVKTIVNPQNIDFGVYFVFQQLSYLLVSYFIPQELGYPQLPMRILNIIHVMIIIFMIILLFILIVIAKYCYNRLKKGSRENGNTYEVILSISCLLSPVLLMYGTIRQDVNIMIGRYLYVNVIPFSVLFILVLQKLIKRHYLKYFGAAFIFLSCILLTYSLHVNAKSNVNLAAKIGQVSVEEISLSNIGSAMRRQNLEIAHLGDMALKLGSKIRSDELETAPVTLTPYYLNNLEIVDGLFQIKGEDPYLVWELDSPLHGEYLVALDLFIPNNQNRLVTGQLFWAIEPSLFSEGESFKFDASSAEMIAPVGKYQQWFQNEPYQYIRFDVEGLNLGETFNVMPTLIIIK